MPFTMCVGDGFLGATTLWVLGGWAFRPYWGRSLCSLAGVRRMLTSLYRPLILQFLKNLASSPFAFPNC